MVKNFEEVVGVQNKLLRTIPSYACEAAELRKQPLGNLFRFNAIEPKQVVRLGDFGSFPVSSHELATPGEITKTTKAIHWKQVTTFQRSWIRRQFGIDPTRKDCPSARCI